MCSCRAQYLLLAVVILLGLASMLSACGAKGDLYLPPKPKAETAGAEAPAATPEQPTTQAR